MRAEHMTFTLLRILFFLSPFSSLSLSLSSLMSQEGGKGPVPHNHHLITPDYQRTSNLLPFLQYFSQGKSWFLSHSPSRVGVREEPNKLPISQYTISPYIMFLIVCPFFSSLHMYLLSFFYIAICFIFQFIDRMSLSRTSHHSCDIFFGFWEGI